MAEGEGGEEKVLQSSPFFASVFPLFPQKRLIRGLKKLKVIICLVYCNQCVVFSMRNPVVYRTAKKAMLKVVM